MQFNNIDVYKKDDEIIYSFRSNRNLCDHNNIDEYRTTNLLLYT